jgi:hypothetical protein
MNGLARQRNIRGNLGAVFGAEAVTKLSNTAKKFITTLVAPCGLSSTERFAIAILFRKSSE